MEAKLMKIFKNLGKANTEILKEKPDNLLPMCFVVDKRYNITAIAMVFTSYEDKVLMRKKIMDFILNQEIKAYILMMPVKVTIKDIKTGIMTPKDAVVRTLYTAKETCRRIILHKGSKIVKDKTMEKIFSAPKTKSQDEWELFAKQKEQKSHIKKLIEYSKKRVGEKNHKWKNESVSKLGLHKYLRRHHKAPEICVICKEKYKGYGNNAQPIKKGLCCESCNIKVIIKRIEDARR